MPLQLPSDATIADEEAFLSGNLGLLIAQFIISFLPAFAELPPGSRLVHYLSLVVVLLSTAVFGQAVVFNRRLSPVPLGASLGLLTTGIAGDVFVATQRITGSFNEAMWVALFVGSVAYTLLFALPVVVRRSMARGSEKTDHK